MEVRYAVVCLLTAILMRRTNSKVVFNVPEYAMQGNSVNLECRIFPFSTSIDSAVVVRDIGTKASPQIATLATHQGLHGDAPSNVHATTSVLTDGIKDIFRIVVSISNVQKADASTYSCSAGRQLPTGYVKKGTKSSYLVIMYRPSGNFPACSSVPPPKAGNLQLKKDVGDTLRLSCTSELGNPRVNIVWGRTGKGVIPDPVETVTPTEIRSEITIVLSASDHDAQFVCISKSGAFPDYAASCLIGPVILPVPESTLSTSNTTTLEPDLQQTPANSSSSSIGSLFSFIDFTSPIFLGAVIAGGSLILIILTTCIVFCVVRCCKCCSGKQGKETQAEDKLASTEINLVMTDCKPSMRSSQDNLTKCQPCAECTPSSVPPEDLVPKCVDEKTMTTHGVILRTRMSSLKQARPLTKDYPPPPNYPRPSKASSLRLSEYRMSFADSILKTPELVRYGNMKDLKTNTYHADEASHMPLRLSVSNMSSETFATCRRHSDAVAYSNLCSLTMKKPQPPPSPLCEEGTSSLSKDALPQIAGETPVLDTAKDADVVARNNLTNLTRKNTRNSPTPIRPNKSPPPPPEDQAYEPISISELTKGITQSASNDLDKDNNMDIEPQNSKVLYTNIVM